MSVAVHEAASVSTRLRSLQLDWPRAGRAGRLNSQTRVDATTRCIASYAAPQKWSGISERQILAVRFDCRAWRFHVCGKGEGEVQDDGP